MKRFLLLWTLAIICLLKLPITNSFAAVVPYPLPYTDENGITYNDVIVAPTGSEERVIYYNYIPNNYPVFFKDPSFGVFSVASHDIHVLWCSSNGTNCDGYSYDDHSIINGDMICTDDSLCFSNVITSRDITFLNAGVFGPDGITYLNYYTDACGFTVNSGALIPSNYVPATSATLQVVVDPQTGGSISGSGINCNSVLGALSDCTEVFSPNQSVMLSKSYNSGYEFVGWELDGAFVGNTPFYSVTMDHGHTVKAKFIKEAADFVYPVLASEQTDPLQNKTNPIGNGWSGYELGSSADPNNGIIGHLGQDYYKPGIDSAGLPVYAVANGTVVEVINGAGQYGWCDNDDHGWGPVVVIKHIKQTGFNTTGSILSSTCNTETNPTTVYSLYGHLSKSSIQNLYVGQSVNMGDQIGTIGAYDTDQSSWATNHLHFELKDEAGFNEGVWYKTGHEGQCPGSSAYVPCTGREVLGVGTAYSHASGFAPNRYIPGVFLLSNQQ